MGSQYRRTTVVGWLGRRPRCGVAPVAAVHPVQGKQGRPPSEGPRRRRADGGDAAGGSAIGSGPCRRSGWNEVRGRPPTRGDGERKGGRSHPGRCCHRSCPRRCRTHRCRLGHSDSHRCRPRRCCRGCHPTDAAAPDVTPGTVAATTVAVAATALASAGVATVAPAVTAVAAAFVTAAAVAVAAAAATQLLPPRPSALPLAAAPPPP